MSVTGDGGTGGVTVPGARLPLHDAGARSLADRAIAASEVVHGAAGAAGRLTHDAGTALSQARSSVGAAAVEAGGRLHIAFHDVEAMSNEIAALSRDATELAASTARIAIDGDLLTTLSVSPVTGMIAEAAIGTAVTGLAQTAVQSSALAVATGAVASSYAAADAWLAAAAGSLRASTEATAMLSHAGTTFVGALAEGAATAVGAQIRGDLGVAAAGAGTVANLGVAAAAVPLLAVGGVGAVSAAFGAEAARALGAAFAEANRAFGGAEDAVNPFVASDVVRYGSVLAAGFDRTFSLDDALAGSVGGIQAILGGTGPFYDDILAGLVTAGVAVGFFHDGDVSVSRAAHVEMEVLERSASRSADALGKDPEEFVLVDGRVVPDGWASAMAGLGQLDDLGGTQRAIIRVFTVLDQGGDAVSYRVQIPSTASWDPSTRSHGSPGDVTSDVYSMLAGSDASLAASVYEAMRQAGIPTGAGAPPVELDGFSLGGIAAAAVAADPRGYNITEIHTAGSPVGAMNIPDGVRVVSLEADHDVVAALDGRRNPARDDWLTVRGPGVRTMDETVSPPMLPGTVHDVRRYAVMGATSELREVGALRIPTGGSVVVDDFEAERVR